MQEVLIDRKCAAPRFVIKPQSTFALEGHSARFTCRIIRYNYIPNYILFTFLTSCLFTFFHFQFDCLHCIMVPQQCGIETEC